MTSSCSGKNLLFYSNHPNDHQSSDFLTELLKNPTLKRQFIMVCVNDRNIRIPEMIRSINRIPLLIISGLPKPIYGQEAISWLKNGNFQNKGNGFDYGSLDPGQNKYAVLSDENKPTEYNQFFNDGYNQGFSDSDNIINQQFASLSSDAGITTYDDSKELKKDMTSLIDARLAALRDQRNNEVPKQVKRIGGLEPNNGGNGMTFAQAQQPQQQQSQQQQQQAPTYNPNPFAPAPQLPFGNNNNMRQLPFNNMAQMPPQLPFGNSNSNSNYNYNYSRNPNF